MTGEVHRNYWGTKWVILPNPAYGLRERVLYGFNSHLTREEKLKAKFNVLKGP